MAPRGSADDGMATAEYAVVLIAACAFAAVLYRILTSEDVSQQLVALVNRALGLAG
nr:DUF4244 domain-containing protein [Allonocardiopsis opalescens]